MGSRKALVGDDEKLAQQLSAETRVTKDTPPIFLAHAATDKTVPVENSILFFEACRKAGVPAEMHIFPSGPHGFGLAAANPVLNTWPDLMLHWMSINHWTAAPNAATPSAALIAYQRLWLIDIPQAPPEHCWCDECRVDLEWV